MKYHTPISILAAKRTAIGKFGGGLKDVSAVELGVAVSKAAMEQANLLACGRVVAGQVLTAGCGMNPARQVVLKAGLAEETPAETLNLVCGSGLRAVASLADAIALEQISDGLALGMESMSRAPHYLPGLRWGLKYGGGSTVDPLESDGLTDPVHGLPMGETAELLAEKFGISREDQDAFAALSQQRYEAAAAGFAEEIVAVPTKAGEFKIDEHPRAGTTAEKLAALRPAFRREGTVTAGNASGMNDGAAALALAAGVQPGALARIAGWSVSGCDPRIMGIGPVGAINQLLRELDWSVAEVDCFEINEAFAAQLLACQRELGLEIEKVNPRGGAIALGHPIGCSGARVLVSLIHYLRQNQLKRGIAALCIGGGMGIALAVEVPQMT